MGESTSSGFGSLLKRVDRHFIACSAIVGAVGLAPIATEQAGAAPFFYQTGAPVLIPNTMGGIFIDINTATPAFALSMSGGLSWEVNLFGVPSLRVAFGNFTTSTTMTGTTTMTFTMGIASIADNASAYALRFASSQSVAAGLFAPRGNTFDFGSWNTSAPYSAPNGFGAIGFRLGSMASTARYGFVSLSVIGTMLFFNGWGLETQVGTAIHVNQGVPEPGSMSLALLAAGATGLAAWRRRFRDDEEAEVTAA